MATAIYIYDNYHSYQKFYPPNVTKEQMFHNEVLELYVKPKPKLSLWVVTQYARNQAIPRPLLTHTIVHFMSGTIDPHDDPELHIKDERPIPILSNDIKVDKPKSVVHFKKPLLLFWRKPKMTLHIDKFCGTHFTKKLRLFAILYDKTQDRLNFILS